MVSKLEIRHYGLSYYQVIARCLRINQKYLNGDITLLCAAQNVRRVCADNKVACVRHSDNLFWPVRPYSRKGE